MRSLVVLLLALAMGARSVHAQDPALVAELAELLRLEDSRSFDAVVLTRAVQHPDTLVRVRAAMAMGRIGDRSATGLLLRLLADPDSGVRTEAAFALGELGDPAALGELGRLVDALPSVSQDVLAVELVTAVAKIGTPQGEAILLRLIERHPAETPNGDRATAAALREAFRLGRSSGLASRLPAYIRQSGGEWRRWAVYSSQRLALPASVEALLEVSGDSDNLTRQWAVAGLRAPSADSAGVARAALVSVLRERLTDGDPQVRVNALRALATFGDSSLASIAASRLADREENVQVQAAATLGALGGSRAAGLLADRWPSAATYALRRAILLALARVAPERALSLAEPWRRDGDWRLRASFAEVLTVARPLDARDRLDSLARDQDPRVAAAALGSLQRLAGEEPDASLLALARSALAHPDVMVRATATAIVAEAAYPEQVDELIAAYRRAESDPLDEARLAAVRALGIVAERAGTDQGRIAERFFARTSRSREYLVRAAVHQAFGAALARQRWGEVFPVETGRTVEDYRDVVRRYVMGPPAGVTIETERGSIRLQLYGYEAPLTVENFLRLVDRRFFDNGRWHRVVPNFVIQDGDPRGDGSGGPGTVLRDEISRRRYERATVGMALSGPDTGGSQFFITHSPQPHLDGAYTVFGQVVSGWEVVDRIVQGDRIRRIVR